jgi:hypothetical protein
MTLLRAFWDAALELDPSAPDEATMRYCSPQELHALWEQVGLTQVETQELLAEAEYADFEDLWAPFPLGVGPTGAYCASLAPERRQALHDAYFRHLGEPSGPFTLTARAWFVRGRR